MQHDDPADLAAAVAESVEAAGGDAVNLRVHLPEVTPDQVEDQIRALGTEVLPRLRPLLA